MKNEYLSEKTKKEILNDYSKKPEAIFIKEVLIPLFERMKYEVIDNQGPQELGKDLILKKINDFQEIEYIAAVVKKGDIANTNPAKKSNTLEEVKRQIKQSLDISLDKIGAKGKYPNKIMVICSGRFSKSAIDEIHTNSTLQNSNILFISNEKLIFLLDTYHPDFFQYKLPTVAMYLKNLLDYITKITSIDTHLSNYVEKLDLKAEKILKNRRYKIDKESPEKIPKKHKRFYWLQGGTGSGKTYTIYKMSKNSLSNISSMKAQPHLQSLAIPIYLNAKQLDYLSPEQSILDYILKNINYATISKNDLLNWISTYQVILVIDDYEQNQKAELINKILNETNSNITVFLLSRKMNENTFSFNENPEVWTLCDVNLKTANKLIKQAIYSADNKSSNIYEDLSSSGAFDRIQMTPLALNVLSYIFSEKADSTPSNMYEFFDMFFQIVLGKWTAKRNTEKAFDYKQVRHFLQRVAYEMVQRKTTSISINKLYPIAKEVLTSVNEENNISEEEFIKKIVDKYEVANIILNKFSFNQKTFQEFLAGCEYVTYHWDKKHLIDNITDIKWEECLIFAAGSKARDDSLLNELKKIKEGTEKDIYFKTKNISFLVQALYQSSENSKLIALKEGLKSMIKLREHKEFMSKLKNIIKEDDPIFYSFCSLIIFSFYYGKKSLFKMITTIYKEETDVRKRAYLLASLTQAHSNSEIDKEEIIKNFPSDVNHTEALVLTQYLSMIKNTSKLSNKLLQDDRVKKIDNKNRQTRQLIKREKRSEFHN